MSGGFFRGTTADQDTRFSNKQAKLMKSQKFAPELEHLVDMTKVKMDVLRPWIAKRVTELLGFEDEVLINFIYGLLDGKNVNGKEIQISITGFMEKNTGKFMKELWTLLLSAQNNASGVPQRFLDEKEEETKRKKADAERITNEIQKKKEREADESVLVQKKMEGGPDTSRTTATDDTLFSKHRNGREPFNSPDDRKESVGRNGRGRIARRSISSHSTESSPSPSRRRSMSRSPKARKWSISSEKEHPNRKGSITPHHTASSRRSPLSRRRSSYRWRSRSRSYSPSFSPQPLRSHHISPHVRRRRSPSPVRRRSPVPARRRSPPPGRRRSPPRRSRRSPSPVRRRSPPHRSRSPAKRGSRPLVRRQSHSPVHDRSPLLAPRRGRRGSTLSPSQGASPSPRRISRSPGGHRSPSPLRQKLSSPRRRRISSPVVHGKRNQKAPSTPRHRHISPESRKPLASDGRKRHSPFDGRSLSLDLSISGSPIRQRSVSPYREKSPTHMRKLILPSSIGKHSSPKTRLGCKSRGEGNLGRSKREDELLDPNKEVPFKAMSLEKTVLSSDSPANTNGCPEDELRSRNNSRRKESKISLGSPIQVTEEPNSTQGELEIRDKFSVRGNNAKDVEKGALLSEQNKMEGGGQHLKPENTAQKFMVKGAGGGSSDSGYADDKKRKRKGSSSRHEVSSDDDSSDSEEDAKRRRRKEEKRLRREKRRQRHEEKRRKKEERRAEKHKLRKVDNPGIEKKIHDKSEDEEEEEEEKKRKLEIELRKKALESLKAKKGVGH